MNRFCCYYLSDYRDLRFTNIRFGAVNIHDLPADEIDRRTVERIIDTLPVAASLIRQHAVCDRCDQPY